MSAHEISWRNVNSISVISKIDKLRILLLCFLVESRILFLFSARVGIVSFYIF